MIHTTGLQVDPELPLGISIELEVILEAASASSSRRDFKGDIDERTTRQNR